MRAAAPTSRASHPETVEAGLAVTKLGRSSVTYAMDIFKQGGAFAAARGHFIHAYVDRATQRLTEIPSAVRTKLEALLRELQLPLRS